MTADANVINEAPKAEAPDEQPAALSEGGHTGEPAGPEQPPAQQRAWSMPKSPVDRKQVDEFGRVAAQAAIKAVTATARAVAALARYGARIVGQIWRAIDAVPPALQLLFLVALLALLGVVGSIALVGTLGLICAVVVVPVCSIALGAIGHRWFSSQGQRSPRAEAPGPEIAASELMRSVVYADKKLASALNSLGTDRHQQAVIALFQAKTAVELALGTEEGTARDDDAPVSVDAYRLRPRIQAGPSSKSSMSGLCPGESNSLAAS